MKQIVKNMIYKPTQGLTIVVLTFVLIVLTSVANAETTKEVKFRVSSYVDKMMLKPAGDIKGHAIGFFSRRGLAFFENDEVATYSNRGWLDLTKGSGTFEGYSTIDYLDQSQTVQKFHGTMKNTKGIISLQGTGDYVNGKGRFAGITGDFTFTCQALTPYSRETGTGAEFYCDAVANQILPSK